MVLLDIEVSLTVSLPDCNNKTTLSALIFTDQRAYIVLQCFLYIVQLQYPFDLVF